MWSSTWFSRSKGKTVNIICYCFVKCFAKLNHLKVIAKLMPEDYFEFSLWRIHSSLLIYESYMKQRKCFHDPSKTSKCVYEFTRICGSKYIGRTEQCLSTRIKEHLLKWLLNSVDKKTKKLYHKSFVRLRTLWILLTLLKWLINKVILNY